MTFDERFAWYLWFFLVGASFFLSLGFNLAVGFGGNVVPFILTTITFGILVFSWLLRVTFLGGKNS